MAEASEEGFGSKWAVVPMIVVVVVVYSIFYAMQKVQYNSSSFHVEK
jgi:hypothetical protein